MGYLTNIKTQHITNSPTKTRGIFQKVWGFYLTQAMIMCCGFVAMTVMNSMAIANL